MMQRNVEWLNANKYRRYPFKDDAAMQLSNGLQLSDSVVLDLQVTALRTSPLALALTAIGISEAGLSFTFNGTGVTFSALVPTDAAYPYTVQAQVNSAVYTVVLGYGCTSLLLMSYGTITCNIPVQPALLVTQASHRVDTIASAVTGNAQLAGAVVLEPGYNCDPSVAGDTIRLAAGKGLGAGRYCNPDDNSVISCRNALLRINGATAGDDGNINLVFQGAKVENLPETNTIRITTPKLLENMKCG